VTWVSAAVTLLVTREKTSEFGVALQGLEITQGQPSRALRGGVGGLRVPAGPDPIRNLGPWTGGTEGEVERLRLPYRALLGEQGFVLLYCHVSQLQLEAANVRGLHNTANTECLQCQSHWARADASWSTRQGMPEVRRPWVDQVEMTFVAQTNLPMGHSFGPLGSLYLLLD
jgi:hypothetical protein